MSTTTDQPPAATGAAGDDTPPEGTPPEGTPPDDTPTEPAPEPPADPGEPDRATLRSFEAELERHEREVREIMGPWMPGYVICPECSGVGLAPPQPEVRDSPLFRACPDCNGYGKVKTGALNPEHAHRDCPTCKGRGYQEKIAADGTPLAGIPGVPDATAPELPPATPPAGNGDEGATFGTPSWLGDPNLGR